jgi:DNA-binding response OmpR family regulator
MPKHILIVEDDSDMAELLRLALAKAGYTTSVATTGAEALNKARRLPPDLVLLDLILPEVNGFSVCETLRKERATSCVPVVMITALPGELPRMAGVEMGADAYYNKPFAIEELVARLDTLLQLPRTRPLAVTGPTPTFASRMPSLATIPSLNASK